MLRGSHWSSNMYMMGLGGGGGGGVCGGYCCCWRCLDEWMGARVCGVCRDMSEGVEVMGVCGGVGVV